MTNLISTIAKLDMIDALNISSVLFIVLGTYLLSKQLFIETIINHFIRILFDYKKYKDISRSLRVVACCYGINRENWTNLGTYGGDNKIQNKLKDLSAPFRGFIYIEISGVFIITSLFINKF